MLMGRIYLTSIPVWLRRDTLHGLPSPVRFRHLRGGVDHKRIAGPETVTVEEICRRAEAREAERVLQPVEAPVHLLRGSPCVRAWSRYASTVAGWTLCGIRLPRRPFRRQAAYVEEAGRVSCRFCLMLIGAAKKGRAL